MKPLPHTYLDDFARTRYPKKGKCEKSSLANGWHRVGMIPVESVLDGGLPGDSAVEICLDCEQVFPKVRAFYAIQQPRLIGQFHARTNANPA